MLIENTDESQAEVAKGHADLSCMIIVWHMFSG